jgi:hypothetical protein
MLLDKFRDEAQKGHKTRPQFTKELILEEIRGGSIGEYLGKPRLRLAKDLKYDLTRKIDDNVSELKY